MRSQYETQRTRNIRAIRAARTILMTSDLVPSQLPFLRSLVQESEARRALYRLARARGAGHREARRVVARTATPQLFADAWLNLYERTETGYAAFPAAPVSNERVDLIDQFFRVARMLDIEPEAITLLWGDK